MSLTCTSYLLYYFSSLMLINFDTNFFQCHFYVPPHERGDLSGHYSICTLVRLLGWLLVATSRLSPPLPGNEITPDLA